jgi:hypothetical protein
MEHHEPDITVASWPELAAWVESLHGEKGRIVFRGEPSTDYDLLPKAGRVGRHAEAARRVPFKREDEMAALERFKKDARPFVAPEPRNDLEWLALARHHNVPTRLLDWSENPLVAAFFATQEAGSETESDTNAVIWFASGLPVISSLEGASPFDIDEISIYRAPHVSPRIPAQYSVFTIHPDPTEPLTNKTCPALRCCLIQAGACEHIRSVLDFCGVNWAALARDLEGLARDVSWRFKWGKPQL